MSNSFLSSPCGLFLENILSFFQLKKCHDENSKKVQCTQLNP